MAQDQNPNPFDPLNQVGPGIVGRFDDSAAAFAEPATVTSRFIPATAEQPAILLVTAQIAPGKHTYSLSQPPGGPQPTKIELARSADYRLLAPFRSQPAANVHIETGPVWTGLKIEEHEGEVTWYAPIEITAGVDPKRLEIHGSIHMIVCQTGGSCDPADSDFVAARRSDRESWNSHRRLAARIGHRACAIDRRQLSVERLVGQIQWQPRSVGRCAWRIG